MHALRMQIPDVVWQSSPPLDGLNILCLDDGAMCDDARITCAVRCAHNTTAIERQADLWYTWQ